MKPIASDYDGSYTHLSQEEKAGVNFIITGNNWTEFHRLYDDGVNIPIFFNPGKHELMDIVNHKASIINKTGVIKYYEDQAEQIAMLKLLCPQCKIIKVERIYK